MPRSVSKPLSLPAVQSFCYFSVTLLAWCGLAWVLMMLTHYFASIVMLAGLVLLFVYLLLAPVNVLHRLLKKPFLAIHRRLPVKLLSEEFVAHFSRAIAIVVMYLVFFLFITVLSIRFVPVTVTQLAGFTENMPHYMENVEDWLTTQPWLESLLSNPNLKSPVSSLEDNADLRSTPNLAVSQAPSKILVLTPKAHLKQSIEKTNQQLQGYFASHLHDGLNNIVGFLGTTLTGIVYAVTGLVLIFYLLLDGQKLRDGFLAILPEEYQETGDFVMSHFHRLMFAFVKSQLILGIATGILMVLLYSLFDVPYAFFLGAFFAALEIIPVLGTWLGYIPCILVLAFISPVKLLLVIGVSYIFILIKHQIIAPKVVGDALGLHPVMVILSLLICAHTGGVLGVVYAIPLASLFNVLLEYGKEKSRLHFLGNAL